jgi:hypothetical protein
VGPNWEPPTGSGAYRASQSEGESTAALSEFGAETGGRCPVDQGAVNGQRPIQDITDSYLTIDDLEALGHPVGHHLK